MENGGNASTIDRTNGDSSANEAGFAVHKLTTDDPTLNAELDYRDLAHMYALADAVERLTPVYWPAACAAVVDLDLMRPQWWMRLALWIARRRHGHTLFGWLELERRFPGTCEPLIHATAEWVRNGKDRTTRDAAGGLNQREVDCLQGVLLNLAETPL